MKFLKHFAMACFMACLFFPCQAQEYDSLLKLDHDSLHDTVKLEVFRKLSRTYNIELKEKFAKKLDSLVDAGNYGLNYKFNANNQLGQVYRKKDLYELALKHQFIALETARSEDNLIEIGIALESIASTYSDAGDPSNSEDYYRKAIDFYRQNDTGYNDYYLTNVHTNLGDEFILREQYDSARVHLLKAQFYTKDLEFKSTPYSKALIKGNLGIVDKATGNTENARIELEEAARFFIDDEDFSAASIYMIHLADVYLALGRQSDALVTAQQSLQLAQSQDLLGELRDANKKLSEIYVLSGDYENAYLHQNAYISYRDSINNEEVIRQLANQQTEFEVGLKQAEVDLANLKNQNQQYVVIGLITFAILLVVFLILIYRNNLIKRRINLELEEQKANLQNLNQTKDKFFSIISHDIRGPINSFHGVSRIIEFSVNSNNTEQLLEIATEVDKATDQLSALLDNLLTWATQQQGHITVIPEKISINQLMESNAMTFGNMAKSKGIKLVNEPGPEMAIWSDRNTTDTIIRNLVNNAIKFTRDGGQVTLSTTTEGDMAVLTIQDTGVGLSLEKQEKLFELKAGNNYGTSGEKGIGLGLQLVKEFVALNNGKIEVESQEGVGTTFKLYLPLFDEASIIA